MLPDAGLFATENVIAPEKRNHEATFIVIFFSFLSGISSGGATPVRLILESRDEYLKIGVKVAETIELKLILFGILLHTLSISCEMSNGPARL